jgi:anthranilate phosphoribosyltransferase
MKHILNKIIERQPLLFTEAKEIIYAIGEEKINDSQIVAMLVGLQMRGLQLEEIKGFREALIELCLPIDLDGSDAIDLCGTGGDSKNTFNISTTTSFVLASMGHKVIKHGNYGVSSLCGSSNVLEELGFVFTNDQNKLNKQLQDSNICFLHAPLFHPTLMKVGPLRKNLGIRTFFNSLGPLVNPVQPKHQLTGTFNLELAKTYQHILKDERKGYRIVYGMDVYDEFTLTDQTRILGGDVDEYLSANSFGLNPINPIDLYSGESVLEAATILRNILSGKGTNSQNNVIAANTALALQCYQPEEKIQNLFLTSLDFIKSGEAGKKHFPNFK